MEIRTANEVDRAEIIDLYMRSQAATGIPNPETYPPDVLGDELYARNAIERYVAVTGGRILGHGLIEDPNPISIDLWKNGISDINARVVEFGGAFVDPQHLRKGIYSELLTHRISVIQQLGAVAVSATWAQNKHVQKKFISHGGIEVARQKIPAGDLCLFVFKLR